ncbi:MAG: RagB/SusD family nutrient uptake outer membrane protein [Bacteroidales bacterium]|nr:RagB/SusD family nutrient uptake outer membrane protein [Bacteroidales bacterium]
MKTIRIISLATLAFLTATSCKDSFLEVENPTGENLDTYYNTDEHIQEALIAAYDPIHWPDWGLDQYNALNIDAEIMADNVWVGGATKTDMQNWHMLFNFEADANNTLSSLWTVDYSGIKRCNDVLFYMENYATGHILTDENRGLYEMQARLLRVFYYNMLWHYFGNVPFYLENLGEPPYTAPQITADEVYSILIEELEAVIDSNKLPLRYYKDADGLNDEGQLGRVTQAFAHMLYAEMVMYQNDEARFTKALNGMKEIINNGGFSLNPDFAAIWETSGEWCDESIWEINYEQTNNERGWSSPLAVGGTVLPTLISPNSFPGDDLWSAGGDGWGFMPIKQETYDMYADNDTRRDGTIWKIDSSVEYTLRYQDTHMWLNKYRPMDKNYKSAGFDNNLNYNNNLRYYRYAECLLNAAELALRGAGSAADALTWVNMVRNRAGVEPLTAVTVDDVLTERRLEFVGEGKRYFDLVRAEGISGASAKNKASGVLVPDSYGYRTNTWNSNKKYIPIAQSELDSDPALVQNTAYFQ